jgi:hypothetical protein
MKIDTYLRARETTSGLNRFLKRNVRRRRGESNSQFEEDHRTARSLMSDPNILGFGVGPKMSGGAVRSAELCLVFFVRRKLPKSRLRRLVEIPKQFHLNAMDGKVGTDIQEWGGFPVAHGALSAGVSVGDLIGNSGTLTLAVKDASSGDPLILGCSHVLASCGNAQAGDQIESPGGSTGIPGANIVGNLLRFTKIDPSSFDNAVDAAVASPINGIALTNQIPGVGTPSGIRDLTQEGVGIINQLQVQRVGVATNLQMGIIRNLHVSTRIVYHQLPGDPSVYFVDLVQYDAVSEEGDSGAAVMDTSAGNNVVGMHIAGMQDGSTSLFTHIRFVLDSMNASF